MTSTGDDGSDTDSLLDYDIASDDEASNENAYIKRSDSDREEDGSDFSEGSIDRENRFLGTSNVWKYFTQEERGLTASLDQQQANDLSLHLYCAHALKERVRDADSERVHGKKRKVDDSKDDSLWCPDATWTAWPTRPEYLPKPGEQFGTSISGSEHEDLPHVSYRKSHERHPGTDLEHEVQAVMLKKATERYRESRTAQSQQLREPDLLLNDDEVEEALRSVAQTIRSQLDELLKRLQRPKRRAGKGKRARSGSRSSRSVSRASTPAMLHGRRRVPALSESIVDSEEDSYEDATSDEDDRNDNEFLSVHRSHKRRPKHLTGWTEVLQAAKLVGLNPTAVQRATDRCASLFGETTALPNLYDCPIKTCNRHGTPFEKAWRFREHLRRTHKLSLKEAHDLQAGLSNTDATNLGVTGGSRSLVIVGRDEPAERITGE